MAGETMPGFMTEEFNAGNLYPVGGHQCDKCDKESVHRWGVRYYCAFHSPFDVDALNELMLTGGGFSETVDMCDDTDNCEHCALYA